MGSPDTMDATDRLLADVADLKVKSAGRDMLLLRLGAVLMAAGVAIAVVAYFMSHNTDSSLDQRDAIVVALIGVSVSVVGVGLFLRYSLGEFLRFWMARLIHQQETASRS